MSKTSSLVILALTATAFSRIIFTLFKDPEGPNLLVVMVTAVIIFGLSLITFGLSAKQEGKKKLLFPLVTQLVVVGIFYLFLK
jgi:hypothetical protein